MHFDGFPLRSSGTLAGSIYASPSAIATSKTCSLSVGWMSPTKRCGEAPMFVQFTNASTNRSILINSDHVRTAFENGDNRVRLVFDKGNGGEHAEEVAGD